MLTKLEKTALITIIGLEGKGHSLLIKSEISDSLMKRLSLARLYTTLESLEAKGYVSRRPGEARPERGWRRRYYYKIEEAGLKALEKEPRTFQWRLWNVRNNYRGTKIIWSIAFVVLFIVWAVTTWSWL